ncbi:MAG: helix-turn-helix domain-containing protein [Nitrospirota bacterium]
MEKTSGLEKHYRVHEVAQMTGLSVATIRKRCLARELGYRKARRAVLIPQSEVEKLLGTFNPAAPLGEST